MKKIMFNDEYSLTQAVLDGRKTMTRRMVKRNQLFKRDPDGMWTDDEIVAWENSGISESDFSSKEDMMDAFEWLKAHIPYKVGEVIAIAQSYKTVYHEQGLETMDMMVSRLKNSKGWSNKMFVKAELMPHQIRITNVRVERLQDISYADCLREGIGKSATDNLIGYPFAIPFNYYCGIDKRGNRYVTPREAFATLIDKVSGKGTWDSNPFCFVYEFELLNQ